MTVAVVTPWYGNEQLWDGYWEAVRAGEPDEVIVVDNATTPPLEFATLRVQENLGFCGGSNRGLEHATSDVVVFLNNDVRLLRRSWLEELVALVEPGVLAGPLRTDPHAWVDGQPVPYIDGWCLAGMRDDLIELGGFDETLEEPGYYSDNLLCLEARAAGMTLRQAHVGLRHLRGMTARQEQALTRHATLTNHSKYVARARELLVAA